VTSRDSSWMGNPKNACLLSNTVKNYALECRILWMTRSAVGRPKNIGWIWRSTRRMSAIDLYWSLYPFGALVGAGFFKRKTGEENGDVVASTTPAFRYLSNSLCSKSSLLAITCKV
jgi:hypothetical protein